MKWYNGREKVGVQNAGVIRCLSCFSLYVSAGSPRSCSAEDCGGEKQRGRGGSLCGLRCQRSDCLFIPHTYLHFSWQTCRQQREAWDRCTHSHTGIGTHTGMGTSIGTQMKQQKKDMFSNRLATLALYTHMVPFIGSEVSVWDTGCILDTWFNCVAMKPVLEKPVKTIVVQITHLSTTPVGKQNQSSSIMCNGLMKYSVSVWASTEMQVLMLDCFCKIKCPWCLVPVSSQCVQAAVTLMSTRVRQVSDGGLHLQSQQYQQRGDLALSRLMVRPAQTFSTTHLQAKPPSTSSVMVSHCGPNYRNCSVGGSRASHSQW